MREGQPKLRVAVVGCGAVAEAFHLPALAANPTVTVTTFVDLDIERAENLAKRCPGATATSGIAGLSDKVDAAVVAVPNWLHAQIGCPLLEAGIHVLMEKPLAIHGAECDQLIASARKSGAKLAVGHVRRFSAGCAHIGEALRSGLLGDISTVEISDGSVFDWPLASGALFQSDRAGGGVLLDSGVHILDLLLDWFGEVERVSYEDNCFGGVESDCNLELKFRCGPTCRVRLTRIRNVDRSWRFQGDRGELECDSGFDPNFQLRLNGFPLQFEANAGAVRPNQPGGIEGAFADQISDFVRAIQADGFPLVSAEAGKRVVELVQSCYRRRSRLLHGWETRGGESAPQADRRRLEGRRVLLIGATGFIGRHVAEALCLREGAEVRALVRDFSRGAAISHLPLEMIGGDVRDEPSLRRAMAGCEFVVHCAYGNSGDAKAQRDSTVAGTRFTLAAARDASVHRIVYLSTIDVYGAPRDGVLTEESPRSNSGGFYAETKREAESLVMDARRRGLSVVVLQPSIVYGPFAPAWTVRILDEIRGGRLALLDGGTGLCNAVYIDDLVSAILESLVRKEADGQTLLISGQQPAPWREFFGAYARMLGKEIPSLSAREHLNRSKKRRRAEHLGPRLLSIFREDASVRQRLLTTPEFGRVIGIVKRLTPKRRFQEIKAAATASGLSPNGAHPDGLNAEELEYFRAKMTVSIQKAQQVIGYTPSWSLEAGMGQTESWARWANLIG